jgi:AraC-like DNA-binding protein
MSRMQPGGMAAADRGPCSAVAFLPAALRRRVEAAEPRIRTVDSMGAAANLVLRDGAAVLIADPTADAGAAGDQMVDLCRRVPGLIPITYARLAPDLIRHVQRLAHFELSDVMLAGFDDAPARFVGIVDLAQSASLTGHVLHRLEPSLSAAAPMLRHAIRDVFASPQRYRSVNDFAEAAHMPRRSFYRSFQPLRLSSPRLLLAASRVVRTIGMLRDPQQTLRDAARRLGYSKPEHLAAHVLHFTGLRLRETRSADFGTVADSITTRLRLEA